MSPECPIITVNVYLRLSNQGELPDYHLGHDFKLNLHLPHNHLFPRPVRENARQVIQSKSRVSTEWRLAAAAQWMKKITDAWFLAAVSNSILPPSQVSGLELALFTKSRYQPSWRAQPQPLSPPAFRDPTHFNRGAFH